MPAPKLDTQLCFALYSASSKLTSVYRRLLEPLDLTYTQYIVLMALWEKDRISISALADKVCLGKATMTPLLKRLEQKKLIQCERVDGNDRQKNVSLTEAGLELSDKANQLSAEALRASCLSKEQADELLSLCQIITGRSC